MKKEEISQIDFHIHDVNETFSPPPTHTIRNVLLVIFWVIVFMMVLMCFIKVPSTTSAGVVITYRDPLNLTYSAKNLNTTKDQAFGIVKLKQQEILEIFKAKTVKVSLASYPEKTYGNVSALIYPAGERFEARDATASVILVMKATSATSIGRKILLKEGMVGNCRFDGNDQSMFKMLFHLTD
ncbi:hypothetical protein [Mucilaginibacter sp.]|uniref:hypothetical protein n=1 Tax=Mucilaginibacter sp. TaxID=1882438 RepID=UPI0025CFA74E|nr:hypothetical protein [Mucilaginibacter sp.]